MGWPFNGLAFFALSTFPSETTRDLWILILTKPLSPAWQFEPGRVTLGFADDFAECGVGLGHELCPQASKSHGNRLSSLICTTP